ncbi:MAG: hypothetical protein LBH37_00890, partial [Oscillospiraceae bacterium]|nr:hypothetical protein [Oscillospiraceae bacterium]
MFSYDTKSKEELVQELDLLTKKYEEFKNKNLNLDMSEDKLSKEQLDLSSPMLDTLISDSNFVVDEEDIQYARVNHKNMGSRNVNYEGVNCKNIDNESINCESTKCRGADGEDIGCEGASYKDIGSENISCKDTSHKNEDDENSCEGTDCRNYGLHEGIRAMKAIFSDILKVNIDNLFIGENSSLSMMFDVISLYLIHGVCGRTPWLKQPRIKFLCPIPGYSGHFNILSYFDIDHILIPMRNDGPDMEIVEKIVSEDESAKGIWCVPKYSNPQGITYSEEVIRRFSRLCPKAPDFRIFWDNAYAVHDLTDSKEELPSLMDECIRTKNEDLPILFCSTSKITFPGAGVAALAASKKNLLEIKKYYQHKTIGFDKLNQLRHAKFFENYEGLLEHMKKHRKLLRPKFQVVLNCLAREFSEDNKNLATWNEPKGGYFVSVDVEPGLAKSIVSL